MKNLNFKKPYALLIIAILFITNAKAQIIYTDIIPDSTIQTTQVAFTNSTVYQFDLNNDAILDFKITVGRNGHAYSSEYVKITPLNGNEVSINNNGWVNSKSYGSVISSSGNWDSITSIVKQVGCGDPFFCNYGVFLNDSNSYAALKIRSGSNYYYGWIRLKINVPYGYGAKCIVYDFAINSIPNEAILTGESSCITPTVSLIASGSLSFCNGDSVTLTANGTGYKYQWKKGGVNIIGATKQTYVAKTAGIYKCKVTNSCGSITSGGKTVTVPCRMTNNSVNALIEKTIRNIHDSDIKKLNVHKINSGAPPTDVLRQTPDDLDNFILAAMNNHHIPGISAAIVKNGKIAWTKGYGYADIDKNIPFTPNTINAEIGSISKTVDATALMQLWEQGLFQLDDPINNYIPFSITNPYFPNVPITFRMLLSHKSSIGENGDVFIYNFDFNNNPSESLGNYVYDILNPGGALYVDSLYFNNYAPGTQWSYSNFAYVLIGYLVEHISGIPFDQYCNQHIFQPLCMNHTSWFFSGVDSNIVSRPYYDDGSGGWVDYGLYQYPDFPDGQIKTTVIDLSRFLLMNMNNGILDGVRILNSSTVSMMRTIQPEDSSYDHSFQTGLGWFYYNPDNIELWGHSGGDLGISAEMHFNITGNTGVILFTNGEDNSSGTPYCTNSDDILCKLLEVADSIPATSQHDLNCSYSFNPCEHGRIYWKNHSSLWAFSSVPMKLGTQHFYNQHQLLTILNKPINGDASIILSKQLIAAKLNAAQGSELSPIIQIINAANNLIANRHLPIQPKVSFASSEGIQMIALATTLFAYNQGWLNAANCSGSGNRDANENEDMFEGKTESNVQLNIAPNPFSNSTTISFSLPQSEKVSVKIFDMTGRIVKKLTDVEMQEGIQQIEWNATDEKGNTVNAGIYFLKLETENYSVTNKISVIK